MYLAGGLCDLKHTEDSAGALQLSPPSFRKIYEALLLVNAHYPCLQPYQFFKNISLSSSLVFFECNYTQYQKEYKEQFLFRFISFVGVVLREELLWLLWMFMPIILHWHKSYESSTKISQNADIILSVKIHVKNVSEAHGSEQQRKGRLVTQ